jgi:D-alanyl-D-alanine carboxypeptidase
MLSRLLVLALFLLPGSVLAGVKETVASLAPQGLVLVVDANGNELLAQNADEPFVPASVTKIVTYVMCHLAFGDLPLAASLDTISAIRSQIMPAFSKVEFA